jgi:mannose/fructose-specific phosphotransferase system component IIA
MNDKKMPYIFLLTHGNWGQALIESAKMIIGSIPNICAFSLMPEQHIEDYSRQIKDELDQLEGNDVLLISDILVGSTTHIAALIGHHHNYMAINGLSLEMLLCAEELRREYRGEELVKNILNHVHYAVCDLGKRLADSSQGN